MKSNHSDLFQRRTFLRGLGVSMALPWMESLPTLAGEAAAGSTAADPPVRFACLFSGNGFQKGEWWAKGRGWNWARCSSRSCRTARS